MNRNAVLERVEARLDEIGVPRHLLKVTKVPSSIHVACVIGKNQIMLQARSGVTEADLEKQLDRIADAWASHQKVSA